MEQLLRKVFSRRALEEGISPDGIAALVRTATPIYEAIVRRRGRSATMLFVGLCGAQGSGKTTIASGIADALRDEGLAVVSLSIDDFYLPRRERERLAEDVHPLLLTRGVPGTHEIDRALVLRRALAGAAPKDETRLPTFDKSRDDRVPSEHEPIVRGCADILLLEGWCVGAIAQAPAALDEPVNALERDEDQAGIWRRYVNAQLEGPYRHLFEQLDLLAFLKAPNFEQVHAWRREQEGKLVARLRAQGRDLVGSAVMDDARLERFIMHYERLTRHILAEMDARADVVVELDNDRKPIGTHSSI